MAMRIPRVYVDFNEMVTKSEVLLSKTDTAVNSDGELVQLSEGTHVAVYSDDYDEHGHRDDLIAEGTAKRNTHGGWTSAACWILVIDANGIRHQSED
jgi:hypothetical protein